MACFSNAILEPLIAVATMVMSLSLNRICVGALTVSKSAVITKKRSALPLRSTAVIEAIARIGTTNGIKSADVQDLIITAVRHRPHQYPS